MNMQEILEAIIGRDIYIILHGLTRGVGAYNQGLCTMPSGGVLYLNRNASL